MPAKHKHEDVATHYLEGGIKLLSQYVNALYKNDLECLKCGYEWQAIYNSYSCKGNRCPKCAGKAKHKHKDVANHYLSENIKLLSQYVNAKTKNDLECLICSHKWSANYNAFASQVQGCPKCSGNVKHNHEDVAAHYLSGNIRLLSQYVNTDHKNSLECLICNHQWESTYTKFSRRNQKCPNCYAQTQYSGRYTGNKAYGIIYSRLYNKISKETAISFSCFFDEDDLRSLSDPIEQIYDECPQANHVDHVIPFSWFDVFSLDEMKACWHPDNLQYLSFSENAKKKDKLSIAEFKILLVDRPNLAEIALTGKYTPEGIRKVALESFKIYYQSIFCSVA